MAERAAIRRTVIYCVDCDEKMTLSGRVEMGQIVSCPECGTAMEVISLDPVKVDWVNGEPLYTDEEEEYR